VLVSEIIYIPNMKSYLEYFHMIGAKYIESLESGVIGALLIPTGMILLYAFAAIVDQLIGASASEQGQSSLIFWVWALAVVPLTVALVGVLSSRLASKYEPRMIQRSIFSAISGIIAVVGSALLFLFISSFLSPPDITSSMADRLSSFVSSIVSLFTDPTALSAMAFCVVIAVLCGLIYDRLTTKKGDSAVA
jgi:hypothetical protein